MGVFTIEYETVIKPSLNRAIEDALKNEVSKVALSAIEDSAQQRIYNAYSPVFLSRRFSFTSDDGYEWSADGNTLTITATSKLQNLYGGDHAEDLGDIVAEGWENFNMPFARPWMDEGIQEKMPDIEKALKVGLERNGF